MDPVAFPMMSGDLEYNDVAEEEDLEVGDGAQAGKRPREACQFHSAH